MFTPLEGSTAHSHGPSTLCTSLAAAVRREPKLIQGHGQQELGWGRSSQAPPRLTLMLASWGRSARPLCQGVPRGPPQEARKQGEAGLTLALTPLAELKMSQGREASARDLLMQLKLPRMDVPQTKAKARPDAPTPFSHATSSFGKPLGGGTCAKVKVKDPEKARKLCPWSSFRPHRCLAELCLHLLSGGPTPNMKLGWLEAIELGGL